MFCRVLGFWLHVCRCGMHVHHLEQCWWTVECCGVCLSTKTTCCQLRYWLFFVILFLTLIFAKQWGDKGLLCLNTSYVPVLVQADDTRPIVRLRLAIIIGLLTTTQAAATMHYLTKAWQQLWVCMVMNKAYLMVAVVDHLDQTLQKNRLIQRLID